VFLTGALEPSGDRSVYEQIEASGAPRLLLDAFGGRLEYHSPWHVDRQFSHLFRGDVEMSEVERVLADEGHADLRLVDNGITERRSQMLGVETVHTYHLIPRAAGKASAVVVHMRRRGLVAEECIAVGDSRGDLEVAAVVGRFFLVANALDKDPEILSLVPDRSRVSVTEEPMSHGFYEAVVRSLAD
jgi:hydroxymethylpyrimidine pyrophosphatase-like HAD family hydrolase